MRRIARLRWMLARLIAPAPIIAAPLTDGPALLIRDRASDNYQAWVAVESLDLGVSMDLSWHPPLDPLALGTVQPPRHHGTFSGTLQ